MPTRTTHRSTSGTKLYAKRNAKGQITDIQTYKRAHRQDIKRSSKAERSKTSAKKSVRKSARKSAGLPRRHSARPDHPVRGILNVRQTSPTGCFQK